MTGLFSYDPPPMGEPEDDGDGIPDGLYQCSRCRLECFRPNRDGECCECHLSPLEWQCSACHMRQPSYMERRRRAEDTAYDEEADIRW